MANTPNNDSLNGQRFTFRPDLPVQPQERDINHGGTIVCQPGDEGVIVQGFDNWNDVDGLTIFSVQFDRGTHTHLSAKDFVLSELANDDADIVCRYCDQILTPLGDTWVNGYDDVQCPDLPTLHTPQ